MTQSEHDWHDFDIEKGYEVAMKDGQVLVRQNGGSVIATLTEEEFEAWRTSDLPNPKGLE